MSSKVNLGVKRGEGEVLSGRVLQIDRNIKGRRHQQVRTAVLNQCEQTNQLKNKCLTSPIKKTVVHAANERSIKAQSNCKPSKVAAKVSERCGRDHWQYYNKYNQTKVNKVDDEKKVYIAPGQYPNRCRPLAVVKNSQLENDQPRNRLKRAVVRGKSDSRCSEKSQSPTPKKPNVVKPPIISRNPTRTFSNITKPKLSDLPRRQTNQQYNSKVEKVNTIHKIWETSSQRLGFERAGNRMMLSSINNSFEQDTHDVDGNCDGPDLDYVYADADSYQNEIAELYSYTEFNEFQQNVKAFEDQMEMYDLPPNWQKQNAEAQRSIVMKLIDQLEVSDRTFRIQAARCILYLAQGCWAEVQSDEEQHQITRDNVLVLYELGVFSSFIDLLNMEIESACSPDIVAVKITNVTLVDSTDLRVILSVLYIITETIRDEREKGSKDYKDIAEAFIQEINTPLTDGELFAVKLLGMITRFCSGAAPHFPMKKVVLLLWKISLLGLGGIETLRKLKMEYRQKAGLDPVTEDTLEVTKYMRASSPPATATDILDNQNPKRNAFKRSLMKQRFLDEQEQMDIELTPGNESAPSSNSGSNNGGDDELSQYYRPFEDPSTSTPNPNNQSMYNQPPPIQPVPLTTRLPWVPKVRQKDIDQFLDISRNKFIGYSLIDDHESLAGLPQPIHEGVKTLRRHMYISLSDVQIKKEEEIARNPISTHEDEIEMTPAETLYQAILPNLPQYMIALLKVLLAASPTSKSKTESINIMADVLPKKMPITATQSTKLTVDMGRHKEIIVKAVSAIILLYLKHFKINHIYQFEFMSQHLVFANCIPLVLKFFNQTITEYVGMKNSIPLLDFPSCVIGEQPDLSGDSFVYGGEVTDKPYSWRNVFSCINLLRILNKLIKWKHSRVMMLVVFKSAPILKKTLKVRHAMMQLYVLKLLKMQTKYLGRQWRKSNMKTMSAIYAKVRHRLNDDWAFGNDLESRPWDFQAEECTLRACVDRFNLRRYPEATQKCGSGVNNGNSGNSDNSASNMGGAAAVVAADGNGYTANTTGNGGTNGNAQFNDYGVEGGFPSDEILTHSDFAFFGHSGWWDRNIELSDYFKENYVTWLEDEVYNNQIDWDAL